jgi:tetratricopeptide (TPR) repeat protein
MIPYLRPLTALFLSLICLATVVPAVGQYGCRVLIARTTGAMDRRQSENAVQFAAKAVLLDPHSGPARFFLGQNLLAVGRREESRETLELARSTFAHLPSALRLLGQAHLQLGDYQRSAEAFAWSLRLAPTPPSEPLIRRQMTLALYRAGRYGESVHAHLLALRRDPSVEVDMQATRINGAALAGLARFALLAVESGLVSQPPRQPSVDQLVELVKLGSESRRLSGVVEFLRIVTESSSMDRARSASALASALFRANQISESVDAAALAVRLAPPDDAEPSLLHLQLLSELVRRDGAAAPRLKQAAAEFVARFPAHAESPQWAAKSR